MLTWDQPLARNVVRRTDAGRDPVVGVINPHRDWCRRSARDRRASGRAEPETSRRGVCRHHEAPLVVLIGLLWVSAGCGSSTPAPTGPAVAEEAARQGRRRGRGDGKRWRPAREGAPAQRAVGTAGTAGTAGAAGTAGGGGGSSSAGMAGGGGSAERPAARAAQVLPEAQRAPAPEPRAPPGWGQRRKRGGGAGTGGSGATAYRRRRRRRCHGLRRHGRGRLPAPVGRCRKPLRGRDIDRVAVEPGSANTVGMDPACGIQLAKRGPGVFQGYERHQWDLHCHGHARRAERRGRGGRHVLRRRERVRRRDVRRAGQSRSPTDASAPFVAPTSPGPRGLSARRASRAQTFARSAAGSAWVLHDGGGVHQEQPTTLAVKQVQREFWPGTSDGRSGVTCSRSARSENFFLSDALMLTDLSH